MRDPMNKIERFCYNHPYFGIKNLMLYITIANVAFWVLSAINPMFLSYLSFDASLILKGQVWRLVTFMLYPPSTGLLAFIAFYFYYWIGNTLEQYWGTGQFTIYFFSGVILSVIYGFVIYFAAGMVIRLDSYYIYLSMFFCFASMFPDTTILLFYIIPVKMKYLAIVDAVFFVLSVIMNPFPINLLPVVAVLNYLVYCGDWLFDFFRPSHVRQRQKTVNFKREARRIQREQANKPYHYKCAVCGRTDVDHPELEFRYCSRCVGYHCFCQDHINNHVHFTE
mgnify:CR=1 FL=1